MSEINHSDDVKISPSRIKPKLPSLSGIHKAQEATNEKWSLQSPKIENSGT